MVLRKPCNKDIWKSSPTYIRRNASPYTLVALKSSQVFCFKSKAKRFFNKSICHRFLRCRKQRSFSNDGAKIVINSDICKFFFYFDEKLQFFITNASFNYVISATLCACLSPFPECSEAPSRRGTIIS